MRWAVVIVVAALLAAWPVEAAPTHRIYLPVLPTEMPSPGPAVPRIDAATKAALRAIYLRGVALGRVPNTFDIGGDSITADPAFLTAIGCGRARLGPYARLAQTITAYTAPPASIGRARTPMRVLPEECPTNNFTIAGMAGAGRVAVNVFPQVTVGARDDNVSLVYVMAGTNDLQLMVPPELYREVLTTMLDSLTTDGIIPIVSTIPPFTRVPAWGPTGDAYNRVLREEADTRHLPLWDYRATFDAPGLVDGGLADGIHPNACPCGSADFTREGLRYGYNHRNLQALQILEKVHRVVVEDGTPDE